MLVRYVQCMSISAYNVCVIKSDCNAFTSQMDSLSTEHMYNADGYMGAQSSVVTANGLD